MKKDNLSERVVFRLTKQEKEEYIKKTKEKGTTPSKESRESVIRYNNAK